MTAGPLDTAAQRPRGSAIRRTPLRRRVDRYPTNTALYADPGLVEQTDYTRRHCRHRRPGATVILAPHGGEIEGGTSELCLAVSGHHPASNAPTPPLYDYWMFEGVRTGDSRRLHVTSTGCDDPVALALCGGAGNALSLHACRDSSAGLSAGTRAVLIGGRNARFRGFLLNELRAAGFQAYAACDHGWLGGMSPKNIVNRTRSAQGAQLELTVSLFRSMFTVDTLAGRSASTTGVFWRFVRATRAALARIEG